MKNWKSILISPSTVLEKAIEVLDREALRLVMVVDEDRRLLGTLTDGDVRRALLRHDTLDTPVDKIMHVNPRVVTGNWPREQVLSLMDQHQLLQIPVLDAERRVVGLETLQNLLSRPRHDNPVLLMAGGFGTRLRPLTDSCPKPLLKVGGRPILELILENFVRSGFHRFFISTHYMPELIQDYFGDGSRWGVSINYVHEQQPLGTGGGLGLLPRGEIDMPLFMMNGDLLTTLDFSNLLDFHSEHGGSATICVREYEYRVPYGVIESDGHKIQAMVEKPLYHHFINAGIYLLSPDLVKSVPQNFRVDMPTLLERQIADGEVVNMFPLHEYWLDIGRMEDFRRAQSDIENL